MQIESRLANFTVDPLAYSCQLTIILDAKTNHFAYIVNNTKHTHTQNIAGCAQCDKLRISSELIEMGKNNNNNNNNGTRRTYRILNESKYFFWVELCVLSCGSKSNHEKNKFCFAVVVALLFHSN